MHRTIAAASFLEDKTAGMEGTDMHNGEYSIQAMKTSAIFQSD